MPANARWCVLLGACASLLGCDFDSDLNRWKGNDAGAPDAGLDAGADAGTDAGTDAGSDAGFDAGLDSGIDAGDDAGVDAGWVFAPDGSYNFAFVSSLTVMPSSVTAGSADAVCAACASDAGLPGVFGAWIGLSSVNAYDRNSMPRVRGWVRPDGRPFADTLPDLILGRTLYPLTLDEHGVDVGTVNVLSGANISGDAVNNCSDWSVANGTFDSTSTSWSGIGWAQAKLAPCGQPVHVYCFGIDQNAQVTLTPAAGKRVFISSDWIFDGGLAGADDHCANDALRLFDGGQPFIAVLSTGSSTAASRFDPSYDGGWVRPDGVFVGDLRSGRLAAPVLIFSFTSLNHGYATGAPAPTTTGTLMTTCSDYTDSGGTFMVQLIAGNENALGVEWFADPNSAKSCGLARLLCAEP
ncbi:MAG: hypothetical protein QM723_31635 [Myxococcaceae bacterium]